MATPYLLGMTERPRIRGVRAEAAGTNTQALGLAETAIQQRAIGHSSSGEGTPRPVRSKVRLRRGAAGKKAASPTTTADLKG